MRDILIRWVPSHQTIEDVRRRRGILTEEDWRGNQEADKLAASAAEANQPSRPEINCYMACSEQTIGLQWMLMTIYCERRNGRVRRAIDRSIEQEIQDMEEAREIPPAEAPPFADQ